VAQSTSSRFGLSLGTRIFLVTAFSIALAVGAAVVVTSILGNRIAAKAVSDALAGSNSVQTFIRERRYDQLQAISTVFVSDAAIASYLAESDRESAADILTERQGQLDFDFAILLSPNGTVLARTDQPGASGENLSKQSLVARLTREFRASGVWAERGKLYYAVGVTIQRGSDLIGFLVTGFAINDVTALEVKRISGTDVAFVGNGSSGQQVVATTLDASVAGRLLPALAVRGDAMARAAQKGETIDQAEITLDGTKWLALLAPLRGAADEPVGVIVALASLDKQLATYRQIQTTLMVVGAAAMLVALVLSFLLSRRTLAPLRQLARAAGAAAQGDYDQRLPAAGGDEVGQMAGAFDKLLRDLREKRDMEDYVGELARTMPEPGGGGGVATPELAQVSLLGIELRRYAHPSMQSDPEVANDRLSLDIRRLQAAVQARHGRIESILGHRILVSFEGDSRTYRALAACAEAMRTLSARESAFDEIVQPAAAVVTGQAVTGSVVWGEGPHRSIVGLPVQQMENLLREATPGDILLSEKVYEELGGAFRQAGFELSPQRGLVSTQRIYMLSADVAASVTGVTVQTPEMLPTPAAGTPLGDRATLAGVAPGSLLGDRFEVLSVLGAGGMGVVYKARDRELDDLVALKMLKKDVSGDRDLLERLKNELKLARKITHPNVLRTFDFGDVGGIPYISMEYVRGITLRYLLDQTGRLPFSAGLRVAKQLCAGLGAAHQVGVIHRDIKPENMIIEQNGNAKLMDFGIARPVQRMQPGQTQAGWIVGTPHYLSPEQLEGREPDQRADVYACGVVFFEIFTGALPFSGENPMQVILKHLNDAPPLPSSVWPQIPKELETIIMRCLEKDRGKRFGNADAVGDALAGLRS
jgi:serine/threonine-protein kinase